MFSVWAYNTHPQIENLAINQLLCDLGKSLCFMSSCTKGGE